MSTDAGSLVQLVSISGPSIHSLNVRTSSFFDIVFKTQVEQSFIIPIISSGDENISSKLQ